MDCYTLVMTHKHNLLTPTINYFKMVKRVCFWVTNKVFSSVSLNLIIIAERADSSILFSKRTCVYKLLYTRVWKLVYILSQFKSSNFSGIVQQTLCQVSLVQLVVQNHYPRTKHIKRESKDLLDVFLAINQKLSKRTLGMSLQTLTQCLVNQFQEVQGSESWTGE